MLVLYLSLLGTEEDREKFEALYRRYHGLMLAVAREVLQENALAEDAVHDAFLKILGRMDKIGETESTATKAFLVIVTKNAARDLLRKNRNRESTEDRFGDGDGAFRGRISSNVSAKKILSAIESLPDAQRDVLHLKVRTQLSDEEIASVLGITGTAVRKRLQRGRKNLLLAIKREEESSC